MGSDLIRWTHNPRLMASRSKPYMHYCRVCFHEIPGPCLVLDNEVLIKCFCSEEHLISFRKRRLRNELTDGDSDG